MRGAWLILVAVVIACASRPPRAPAGSALACDAAASAVTRTTVRGTEAWCEDDRGLRSGPFERRFPGGQLAERGHYAAGVLDGEQASFYANGTPHMRGRHVRGLREGAWRAWHENGKPWLEVTYAGGAPSGTWREYDYTGDKMFEGTYRGGRLDGAWQAFRGGDVAVTGSSSGGRLEGRVVDHDPSGSTCDLGYRDNRLHGPVTCRDKDGKVTYSGEYVDGVKQGGDAR
jgi:antitoxin component YwqK of YwqJK toxin-antitoxin module